MDRNITYVKDYVYSINNVYMANSGTCEQFNYSISELAKNVKLERNVHS